MIRKYDPATIQRAEDVLAFIEQIPDPIDRLARMSRFVLNQAHILCQWSQGRALKVADVRRIAAALEKGLRDIDASPAVLDAWHGRALRHSFATCDWGMGAVHTAVDFARRVRGCLPRDLRGTAWAKQARGNLLAVLGNCTMTELNGQCIMLHHQITMEQAAQIDGQHASTPDKKDASGFTVDWSRDDDNTVVAVRYDGAVIDLPAGKPRTVLGLLIEGMDAILQYSDFEKHHIGSQAEPQVLRNCIRTIRSCLKANNLPYTVVNDSGIGYRLTRTG